MCVNENQLRDFLSIYSAAQASDDGQRCMVAPHPDLLAKMQTQLRQIRESRDGMLSSMLRMSEPKLQGLNDGTLRPDIEFPFATPPSTIRNAAMNRAAPLRDTVRVIVVLVEFADQKFDASHDKDHFKKLFFSDNSAEQRSVRDYYHEVTHRLISIDGEVVGPFTLPRKLADYAQGKSGMGNQQPNAQTMALDAAIAAKSAVDFSPYDNDHDGYVDAYVIVHAGTGAEVSGNPNQIWSHKWVLADGPLPANSTRIYAYLTVPEDARIGVCCHELGHLLFGFPDLYDTDYSSQGIGNWCLMSGGSWGGGGDVPAHPCAWCKASQGWVSVSNSTSNGVVRIEDVKTSYSVVRVWRDGAASSEYFLLENRQRTQFDESLPGQGLLIWHIDENVRDNTDERHYKVALMQADGHDDLAHAASTTNQGGDSGDPYPGSSSNKEFGNNTVPNSKAYNGQPSGVGVSQIREAGGAITAVLRVHPEPSTIVQTGGAGVAGSRGGLAGRVSALEAEVARLQQTVGPDGAVWYGRIRREMLEPGKDESPEADEFRRLADTAQYITH